MTKQFIEDKKKEFEEKFPLKNINLNDTFLDINYSVKVIESTPESIWNFIESTITQAISENDLMWGERVKGLMDRSVYVKDVGNVIFIEDIDNLLIKKNE